MHPLHTACVWLSLGSLCVLHQDHVTTATAMVGNQEATTCDNHDDNPPPAIVRWVFIFFFFLWSWGGLSGANHLHQPWWQPHHRHRQVGYGFFFNDTILFEDFHCYIKLYYFMFFHRHRKVGYDFFFSFLETDLKQIN